MTNKDIYLASLRMIAESASEEDNEDYADRAYYILAAFCCNVFDINNDLRRVAGLEATAVPEEVRLVENEDFPCQPILFSAATHYLGSMLTIDSFPELSDNLYDKYCDIISRISDSIPEPEQEAKPEPEPEPAPMAELEKIRDVYAFD